MAALAHQQAPDGEGMRQAFDAGQLATTLGVTPEESSAFDAAVAAWLDWYRPRAGLGDAGSPLPDAWVSERLEHTFSLTAATIRPRCSSSHPGYSGGRLDWDAFTLQDVARRRRHTASEHGSTPCRYRSTSRACRSYASGSWARGSTSRACRRTGRHRPRLLLVEFALTFASDWFLVPVPVPVGALIEHGRPDRHRYVRRCDAHPRGRAGSGADPSWALERFSDATDMDRASGLLLVPPPPAGGLKTDPIEEVAFVRDELANLVWAIEETNPA